jgi:hypothetical protein
MCKGQSSCGTRGLALVLHVLPKKKSLRVIGLDAEIGRAISSGGWIMTGSTRRRGVDGIPPRRVAMAVLLGGLGTCDCDAKIVLAAEQGRPARRLGTTGQDVYVRD